MTSEPTDGVTSQDFKVAAALARWCVECAEHLLRTAKAEPKLAAYHYGRFCAGFQRFNEALGRVEKRLTAMRAEPAIHAGTEYRSYLEAAWEVCGRVWEAGAIGTEEPMRALRRLAALRPQAWKFNPDPAPDSEPFLFGPDYLKANAAEIAASLATLAPLENPKGLIFRIEKEYVDSIRHFENVTPGRAAGIEPRTEAARPETPAPKKRAKRNEGKAAAVKGYYVACLERRELPPGPTDLARIVGCDPGTASRVISELEARRKAYAREDAGERYRDHA